MINLKEFLVFVNKVERTEKGVLKLEDCLDNISLRDNSICSLLNNSDRIAFLLMGGEINQYNEINVAFQDDFWSLIDSGKSEFTIMEKDEEKHIILNNWTDFYNFWKERL